MRSRFALMLVGLCALSACAKPQPASEATVQFYKTQNVQPLKAATEKVLTDMGYIKSAGWKELPRLNSVKAEELRMSFMRITPGEGCDFSSAVSKVFSPTAGTEQQSAVGVSFFRGTCDLAKKTMDGSLDNDPMKMDYFFRKVSELSGVERLPAQINIKTRLPK
jgi:hypothetical protein